MNNLTGVFSRYYSILSLNLEVGLSGIDILSLLDFRGWLERVDGWSQKEGKEGMEDVRFNLGPWWQEEGLVKE
jgi:hypothetical protein